MSETYAIESFISSCDDMMIADESILLNASKFFINLKEVVIKLWNAFSKMVMDKLKSLRKLVPQTKSDRIKQLQKTLEEKELEITKLKQTQNKQNKLLYAVNEINRENGKYLDSMGNTRFNPLTLAKREDTHLQKLNDEVTQIKLLIQEGQMVNERLVTDSRKIKDISDRYYLSNNQLFGDMKEMLQIFESKINMINSWSRINAAKVDGIKPIKINESIGSLSERCLDNNLGPANKCTILTSNIQKNIKIIADLKKEDKELTPVTMYATFIEYSKRFHNDLYRIFNELKEKKQNILKTLDVFIKTSDTTNDTYMNIMKKAHATSIADFNYLQKIYISVLNTF